MIGTGGHDALVLKAIPAKHDVVGLNLHGHGVPVHEAMRQAQTALSFFFFFFLSLFWFALLSGLEPSEE